MTPEMGKGLFRIALFIILLAAAMLLFLTPGTAEFVIDIAALVVGLITVAVVAVLARWSARR